MLQSNNEVLNPDSSFQGHQLGITNVLQQNTNAQCPGWDAENWMPCMRVTENEILIETQNPHRDSQSPTENRSLEFFEACHFCLKFSCSQMISEAKDINRYVTRIHFRRCFDNINVGWDASKPYCPCRSLCT